MREKKHTWHQFTCSGCETGRQRGQEGERGREGERERGKVTCSHDDRKSSEIPGVLCGVVNYLCISSGNKPKALVSQHKKNGSYMQHMCKKHQLIDGLHATRYI